MPTRRRFLSIVAGCAACLPLARAQGGTTASVSTWRGTALGALASLTLVHPDRARARASIDACVAEIARLESIFSLYRADSALSRLNAAGELAHPPHELTELLAFGLSLSALSNGAFDPTVQPLYRLYSAHFERDPRRTGPASEDIARVLRSVDYRAVEVRPDRIRLRRPGMGITLNGIAQGFITDRVAERLRADGFDNVLVDLGEARALGQRSDGAAWRAAVRDPRDPMRTLFELTLHGEKLSALATSAGYGTIFGADPHTHHLLDPHTGTSANHYLSVSVTAPRALVADGLSTALFIARPQRLERLLAAYPAASAHVVTLSGHVSRYAGA
jgi:thiamine biosynthesis lipoprotein